MTLLETKLIALFVEIEKQLEPTITFSQKWVSVNETQKQVIQFRDYKASMMNSYLKVYPKINNSRAYIEAKEIFDRDQVFVKGVKKAGYWGALMGYCSNWFQVAEELIRAK